MKKRFMRLMSVLTCVTMITQSSAGMVTVYAEPDSGQAQEMQEDADVFWSGEENADGQDDVSADYEGIIDQEEVLSSGDDETAPVDEDVVAEDEVTSVDGNDDPSQPTPPGDGQEVVGGYIEMPWDDNTPVVDDDLDYDEALEMMVNDSSDEEDALGENMPSPDRYVEEPASIESKYPAETDSEMLSYLKNTFPATRDQNPYGTCWVHAATALTEFYMIKHGLKDKQGSVNKNVNYSELQLVYFAYNKAPDPVNGSTGDKFAWNNDIGKKYSFLNLGGNIGIAAQSLMRYNGMMEDKEDAAYSNAEAVLSGGLADEYARSKDVAHLKNEYHINIKENPKLVKQAIKENGIVGVSFFANSKFYNSSTNSFYNDTDTSSNHAVAIVGWNDDYPASNFNTNPGSNGAWLVRNSWTAATTYSFSSYFWLSYKDTSLNSTAYVYEMADMDKDEYYDNNYNYDSQTHGTVTWDGGTTKLANVFTVVNPSETLKAVQVTAGTCAPDEYTVEIYKDLTNTGDPESGTKIDVATTTGRLPFAGQYTIPLNSPVDLSQGETFSIVVTTEGGIDRECDCAVGGQGESDVCINEGESFINRDSAWSDLSKSSSGGYFGNLCIRALTNTNSGALLPDRIANLLVKSVTDQSVALTWSPSRTTEGYEVWYSDSENGTYTMAGQTDAGNRLFKLGNLTGATTYYFKVYPIKNGLRYDAGVSPTVSARTLAGTPNVEVVKVGKYTANIRWDPLENCDGYEYQMFKENLAFTLRDNKKSNEVRLTSITPGETYRVEVRSYEEVNGTRSYSPTGKAYFTAESGTGEPVSNLKAAPYASSAVVLSWDKPDEAAYYIIEKSEDGKVFEELTTTYNNEYHVWDLDSSVKHYFRVSAVYYKTDGRDSIVSQVVDSYTMLPAVSVKDISEVDGSLKVTWDGVSGVEYYSVYRKETSGGEYLPLALVSGQTTYTDENVLPGNYYYYMVYACRTNVLTDSQGGSYYPKAYAIPLAMVKDLKISNITQRGATLSWSAIRGAQGYIIEQYDGSFSEYDRIGPDSTTYILDGLQPNTQYKFCVSAFTSDFYNGTSASTSSFTTLSSGPADASLFTLTDKIAIYDGQGHSVTVTCSDEEMTNKGYDVYYGKVINGKVSSYSADLPVYVGDYKIKIQTKDTTYYTAKELTDDDWVLTINPKTVGLNWSNTEFVYDGNSHVPTASLTGVLASDECTVTVTGEEKDAGTHTATAYSLSNSNYKLPADNTKDFTINKAAVSDKTATGGARYGQRGTVDLSEYIVSGATLKANGLTIIDGNKTLTGTTTLDGIILRFTFVNDVNKVGKSATVTLKMDGGNNHDDYIITVTLTVIDKPIQTVTFTNVTGGSVIKTYGDRDFTITATAQETITYSSSDEDVATVNENTGAVHILKAGETVITATAAESDEYAEGSASYTLTVEQKEIGISWSNTSFTYDSTSKVPTAKATGLLRGDTCPLTVDGAQTNAGSSYTATVTAAENTNYKLPDSVTCSFDIKKRSVTITGLSVKDKDYDGTTDAEITGTAVIDNMIDGDDLFVSYGTAAFESADSGDDITVSFTGFELTGDDKDNYSLTAQPADVTADILALPMTVAANNVEVTYDGEEYGITVNVTKPASGYSIVYGTTRGSYRYTNSPVFKDAGEYTVYYKVTAPNYSAYSDSATVKINPAEAVLTAPIAKTPEYNGTSQALANAGSTTDGDIEYSTDNRTWSKNIPTGKDAGDYEVWWRFTADANHTGTDGGKLEPKINKAALTVTAEDQTITYGGSIATDASMYTVEGNVASNETLTVKLTADMTDYKIVPAVTVKSGRKDVSYNYEITTVSGDLTVAPAPLTITPNSGQSKVYGSADPVLTYKVSGLVGSDTKDVITGSLKREAGDDVGSYEIMNDDLSADNYVITVTSGVKFSITPKSITGATVTLDNTQFEYSGETMTVNVSKVELSDGTVLDADTDYVVSGETSETDKGNYTVTVTGTGNYKDEAKASWRICVKPMTVTCSNVNVTYDGNAHGITLNVEDPESGYTVRYGLEEGTYDLEECPEITDVGTITVYYKVTEDNYDDYIGCATVTVGAADAVWTVPEALTFDYDGTVHEVVSAGSSDDGVIEYSSDNETWSADVPTGKDAGDYDIWWRFTPDGNHTGTDGGKLESKINKVDLTITPDSNLSKVYGEADPELTYTAEGLVGNETIADAITGSLKREPGDDAGEYEITNDDLSADNYEITVTEGIYFTITPKSMADTIVTLDKNQFEFDDITKTVNITEVKLADGTVLDAATDYTVSGNLAEKAIGDYTVTVTGTGNYVGEVTIAWYIVEKIETMGVVVGSVKTVYDGMPHGIDLVISEPLEGYRIEYETKPGIFETIDAPTITDVGSLEVSFRISAKGYETFYGSENVTIDPAPVTVKADDMTKTEGDADPEFTASVTGLIESVSQNKLVYTISRAAGETAGTYAITPAGEAVQGNYAVTYEPGILTILKKKDSSSSSSGKDSSSSSSGKDSSSSSSEKDSSSSSAKPEVTVSMDKVDGVEVKSVTFNHDVAVKQKLDVSAYVGVHKKYMVYPKGYAKVSKKTMLITPKKPGDITIIACDKENKVWVPKEIITLKADSTRVVEKTIDAVISEGIIDGKLNIEDGALTPDRWESTKPEVAKVDEKTGMITPVSEGKTTIIAYYGTGKNAAKVKFKVKVWDL